MALYIFPLFPPIIVPMSSLMPCRGFDTQVPTHVIFYCRTGGAFQKLEALHDIPSSLYVPYFLSDALVHSVPFMLFKSTLINWSSQLVVRRIIGLIDVIPKFLNVASTRSRLKTTTLMQPAGLRQV